MEGIQSLRFLIKLSKSFYGIYKPDLLLKIAPDIMNSIIVDYRTSIIVLNFIYLKIKKLTINYFPKTKTAGTLCKSGLEAFQSFILFVLINSSVG